MSIHSAALLTPYAPSFGVGRNPEPDTTLVTEAPGRSDMLGAQARMSRQGPIRLVDRTSSHTGSGVCSTSSSADPPEKALLTRMSIPPKASRAASAIVSAADSSADVRGDGLDAGAGLLSNRGGNAVEPGAPARDHQHVRALPRRIRG